MRTIDKEFRHFLPIAGLAGIALFLTAIRNVKGANKHLLTAMEVLITVSIPSIAGLQFLMKSDYGQSVFSGGIVIFSVLWVIYFGFKKGKDDDEEKDIKNAKYQIILMFLTLVSFSIVAFVSIETLQNLNT